MTTQQANAFEAKSKKIGELLRAAKIKHNEECKKQKNMKSNYRCSNFDSGPVASSIISKFRAE